MKDVPCSLAFDLKCANSVLGISSHSGKFACLYCEGECGLEAGKPRTLGSLDYHYERYVSDGKKRTRMQDYKNVINPRLVYHQEDPEIRLEQKVPPPELHIMMGVVDKLCTLLLCIWPLFEKWLKSHYIMMRGYHGSGLDGNNASRFLSLVNVLERDLTSSERIDLLPVIV